MNLHQKLVEVRKNISVTADQSGRTGSATFRFISSTQLVNKIQELLNEYNVLLIPAIVSQNVEIVTLANKDGAVRQEFLTTGVLQYQWINADNPEEILTVPWSFSGSSATSCLNSSTLPQRKLKQRGINRNSNTNVVTHCRFQRMQQKRLTSC